MIKRWVAGQGDSFKEIVDSGDIIGTKRKYFDMMYTPGAIS